MKDDIKKVIQEKYSQIAKSTNQGCCGPKSSCCGSDIQYSMIGDEYQNIEGYVQEADLGLGCGIPTEFANIKMGDVVLDLGCGAGNDVFIARNFVGETGKVIGIDMTKEMIQKANFNKEKLGFQNVEFRLGEIENLPVENETIDVVISNCVLNLVPDKKKAFSEIYRVLKKSGHFCISDIVVEGKLPAELKKSAELYVGCVAGALQKDEYLKIILEENFKNIVIKREKKISLPESLIKKFLSEEEFLQFLNSSSGIISITIYGEK